MLVFTGTEEDLKGFTYRVDVEKESYTIPITDDYIDSELEINDGKIIINPNWCKKRVKNHIVFNYYGEDRNIEIDNDWDLDIIYDLIQNGLVKKVGE